MKHGFFRVAAAIPSVKVADVDYNINSILTLACEADAMRARIVVFPEMSVTGYTCGDLFHNSALIKRSQEGLRRLCDQTANLDTALIVGAPYLENGNLYNAAYIIYKGSIEGIVAKTYLPDYNEFYEKRWFRPAADDLRKSLFTIDGVEFGVEICEDLWAPIPPSSTLAMAGAEIIFNLSASDDIIGKYAYLRKLVEQQSARCIAAYVYAGAGFGESSTDLVFDGKALIAENGAILSEAKRWISTPQLIVNDIDVDALRRDRMHINTFADCAARNEADMSVRPIDRQFNIDALANSADSGVVDISDLFVKKSLSGDDTDAPDLLREVNPTPFVPASDEHITERCDEIINIQVAGLAQRLNSTNTRKLVVGISGGLDSTLALLVAAKTFDRLGLDRKGIIGVTMPGFGTTGRTYNNALTMMRTLGVTVREIPIADAVNLHFRDIGHDAAVTDVTYENSQARERTQILMDVANQVGGMVLGTGDLSELALGWATYNGDHMSMYGVNAGVPKTLVKYLVRNFADSSANEEEREALLDVIDTPISPELTPASEDGDIKQKTEDLVGPYELHDFFLYYTLRYGFSPKKIYYLATKAFPGRMPEEIKHWLKTFCRRFFNQQFKRSCLPDGPKVGSVCLSPRGDWRMPSDASSALWLRECDEL